MKRAAVLTLALAFWAGDAAPEAWSGTRGEAGTRAVAATAEESAAIPAPPATEPHPNQRSPAAEPAGGAGAPATEPALRTPPLALTPAEYNNTIADLLGFPRDSEGWPARTELADRLSPRRAASKGVFLPPPPPPPWPWRFPAEPGSEGFEGIVQGQNPSSYQVEELHLAAMHFASYALLSPTFFACEGWAELPAAEQAACAGTSIERFARRAYRRPLRAAERERLRDFWQANRGAGPLDEAVALTVAGILQAPAFHFRVEPGAEGGRGDGDRAGSGAGQAGPGADQAGPGADQAGSGADPWTLASRLSYFLWDSMPDAELFAAAEAGELATAAGVERQARRMLDDPKARPAVVRFHHQWLGTEDVLLIAPARRAFGPRFGIAPRMGEANDDDIEWPTILGPVRHSLLLEAGLFVERTVFDGDGTFTALMTDHHGYLSDATAPIHGAGAVRDPGGTPVTRPIEFVAISIGRKDSLTLYPATFPPAERAGVLTLPAVLAVGAYAVQPGPILRGVRVLERIACMHLGTPIQGAETALPPDTLAVESTNRERTATATDRPACASCHRRINPPGFAFEHYDALGAWRAEDNGQPVDASGTLHLPGGETLTFTDGVDFARQLGASRRVRDCYALHWTRYALGDRIASSEPALEPIRRRFREDDSIKDLLVSIATSDLFRFGAGADADAPGDAR
ncbi:MAG: DUF1592 domain-containing protein [Acidobacteria bacterium]|nr:DUF1592 domain-containing protein [Acidobacteriota bacterium]